MFLALFRAKPISPPSLLAFEAEKSVSKKREKGERRTLVRALCTNSSFVITAILFIVLFGTMTSLPVYLATLFSPGNYTVSALSTIGSFSVVGGMIGSPSAGTMLDKTGGYRCAARIQTISCAIFQAMAIYVIPIGNLTLACIWCFGIGFWFSWTFPCYINYSILITHPIPSDTTNGIMIALSFVYSSLAGIFMTKIFEINWFLG